MEKIIALFLLLSAAIIGLTSSCFGLEMEVASKLETDNAFGNRVDMSAGETRLFYVDIRPLQDSSEDRYQWKIGAETPVFMAGSLRPQGLLKELENPAGYRASSNVFFDVPGFSLDSALAKGNTSGTVLNLLPRSLHLFAAAGSSFPNVLGGYGTIPVTETCILSVAVAYGLDAAETETSTWFFEDPPAVGDNLLHTGIELLFTSRYIEVGCAAGFSGGEFSMPGFFFRTVTVVSLPFLSLQAVVTANNPRYRSLSGNLPGTIKAWEGVCTILPRWIFSLEAAYGRKITRPPIIPAGFRGYQDYAEITGELEADPFSLTGGWVWRLSFLESGDVMLQQKLSLIAALDTASVSVKGRGEYGWDYVGISQKNASVDVVLRAGNFRFLCGGTVRKTDEWQVSGSIKGTYTFDTGNGYAGLTLEETDTSFFSEKPADENHTADTLTAEAVMSRIAVTIGWKVRTDYEDSFF